MVLPRTQVGTLLWICIGCVLALARGAPGADRPVAAATRSRAARRPAGLISPTIHLHASTAKIHGKRAKYEKGGSKDNIGFWIDKNDWVSWDFTVTVPDTVAVLMTYACPPGDAGSRYSLTVERQNPLGEALEGSPLGRYLKETISPLRVAKQELVGTVPNTGNWGRFITEQLGEMTVDRPGNYTVAVRVKKMARGALMNLQAITFRSTRWDKTLVAWWQFEEGRGSTTLDGARGDRDVVEFARWVGGSSGTGLLFNGFSSAVSRLAEGVPDLTEAMTIEAWVRLDSRQEAWCPVVNHLSYPRGFFFGLDGAGDLGLHMAIGGKWVVCSAGVKLPVGDWVHVAATFASDRGIAVYADGKQANRLPTKGRMTPAEATDLLIGRHSHQPWVFRGVIDEVKIYNRALSPAELREHHEWGRALIPPQQRIALRGARADRTRPRVFERVTLDVDLEASYDNPFDAGDVRVDAEVVTPTGRVWSVPGFLHQAYRRRQEKGAEFLEAMGEPRWQVRLSFDEPGEHWVQVSARDRTGSAILAPVTLEVEDADVPGMIRRHATDRRYFVTDRGETFFPIGANVCWADGSRATYDYDAWLAEYAKSGSNFFRVWLSPQWPTLSLNTLASGFDHIDLHRAWRLDHVVQTAERLDLRIMFCIDSFNIIRTNKRSPGNWEDAPYIRARGGPLDQPQQYFTSTWSLRAYRNRLRYLVARWGYSPNVFAWEFWNEVDCMDDYDPNAKTIRDWHAAMASHLRSLDPWRHLITTSYARTPGDPAVDSLPGLDFVMSHSYGAKDMAQDLGKHLTDKQAARDRPHFHGELGIFGSGKQTSDTDPNGVHVHNGVFSCVGQGQAGTPMTWWWDSYVHPRGLYRILASFSRWIDGFDFVAQQARPAKAEILQKSLTVIEPTVLKPVPGSWDPAPFNRPVAVTVDRNGLFTSSQPIADVLHGTGFHKKLHNPVTFTFDVPKATTFAIHVTKYSGHADSKLRVSLDGKLALEKLFAVPEGNTETTLTQLAGTYAIKLPAGKHTVKIENVGTDWLGIGSYTIPWLRAAKSVPTPLRVYALAGNTQALVWVQNKRHTWPEATRKGYVPAPVTGASLKLAGLTPGRWAVEHWDTLAGRTTSTEQLFAHGDGILTVALPDITWDAALRLRYRAED